MLSGTEWAIIIQPSISDRARSSEHIHITHNWDILSTLVADACFDQRRAGCCLAARIFWVYKASMGFVEIYCEQSIPNFVFVLSGLTHTSVNYKKLNLMNIWNHLAFGYTCSLFNVNFVKLIFSCCPCFTGCLIQWKGLLQKELPFQLSCRQSE